MAQRFKTRTLQAPIFSGSYLYATGDFTNANFTGANLTDAYLYAGGIFTNANFTGANLHRRVTERGDLGSAVLGQHHLSWRNR